jgi:hypothetical protein
MQSFHLGSVIVALVGLSFSVAVRKIGWLCKSELVVGSPYISHQQTEPYRLSTINMTRERSTLLVHQTGT